MEELQELKTGRRKSAVARVRLMAGNGEITVNKRSVRDYFPREAHRTLIQQPFQSTNTVKQYNVFANVHGGGSTGQAGALRHGIARALLEINPELKDQLRKDGLLTRDSRVKERKKYGQKGARARFQFSKR